MTTHAFPRRRDSLRCRICGEPAEYVEQVTLPAIHVAMSGRVVQEYRESPQYYCDAHTGVAA